LCGRCRPWPDDRDDRVDDGGNRHGLWGRLAIIALAIATAHFIIVFLFPRIAAQLPRSPYSGFALRVVYEDGRGVLRDVLSESTRHGFSISHIETRHLRRDAPGSARSP